MTSPDENGGVENGRQKSNRDRCNPHTGTQGKKKQKETIQRVKPYKQSDTTRKGSNQKEL